MIAGKNDKAILSYFSTQSDPYRLADRLGAFSSGNGGDVPDRAEVLQRLMLMTLSDSERILNQRGLR